MAENNNINTLINLEGLITFKNRIQSKIDTVTESISTETTRATNAEQSLSARISEVTTTVGNLKTIDLKVLGENEYNTETGVPTVSNPASNFIYLVPDNTTEGAGNYIEWLYVGETFERIGTTAVDLANYALKSTVETLNTKVDTNEADIEDKVTTHSTNKSNPHGVTKAQVGLGNVENTALSTWAGSSNITKLGTINSGTVPLARISDADDLKKIEALTGASGLLKKTAANTWALDTTSYATASSVPTTYVKSASVSGNTLTLTPASGTNVTFTNTTYTTATSTTAGLIKIGYTSTGKNYAVQLSEGKAYVNVPWTNTTYTTATSTTAGLIKIGYTESGKNYPVELSDGKAYVNVPWTNTTYSVATTSANGLMSKEDKAKLNGLEISTTTNLGIDNKKTTQQIGYVSGLTKATWNSNQTDGALYRQAYSSTWAHMIFGDYRTGHLAVRGLSGGTFTTWYNVLDSGNFSTWAAKASHTHTWSNISDRATCDIDTSGTISGSSYKFHNSSTASITYNSTTGAIEFNVG